MRMPGCLGKPSSFWTIVRRVVESLPMHPGELKKRFFSESGSGGGRKGNFKSPFQTRYPVKDPPENFAPSHLNHKNFEAVEFLPVAIFRPFRCSTECLGPGAGKCDTYKNCEYYAYHRFSFAEIQYRVLKLRQTRMKEEFVRVVYDYEAVGSPPVRALGPNKKDTPGDKGGGDCPKPRDGDGGGAAGKGAAAPEKPPEPKK